MCVRAGMCVFVCVYAARCVCVDLFNPIEFTVIISFYLLHQNVFLNEPL